MALEIRSSEFPYNMAGWLSEKSRHVLEAAAEVRERMKARQDLPAGLIDDLDEYMAPLLWDATKILSFSTGGSGVLLIVI